MLQRTKAEQVERVFKEFISKYKTISEAAEENPVTLLKIFKPLGLKWRNEKLVELISQLSKQNIPEDKKDIEALPGVGKYATNAFLSFHLNKKAPIMDSNAVRFWSRVLGFDPPKETHKKKWFYELTEYLTPDTQFKKFNYAVLDLTRTICKLKPICNECPLNNNCKYYLVVNEPK